MIVAHLADLHLGYRAYHRAEGGRNLRQRDVAQAFQSSVQELIRLGPDLILVAGDVFDGPEPSAGALVALARGLETLRGALPETPVLMVAGARDTPRSWGDPGALAALDTVPNVEAATGTARSVRLLDGRVHVLLLPHRSVLREPRPEIRPDPDARWNVLLAYGRVRTSDEDEGPGEDDAAEAPSSIPPPLEVRRDQWDYVALGHEHGRREVAPGVAYAGSLERVGPEPWTEALVEKGFVVRDLASEESRFVPVHGRAVVALAPIRWDPERPDRLNERIREVSREIPGGLEGKIVRLRLEGVGPEELASLDRDLMASLRSRTFHLAVEVEGPHGEEAHPPAAGGDELLSRVLDVMPERPDAAEPLEEAVRRFLAGEAASSPSPADRGDGP